nr:unnamed protein product [Callosobruchus chinensis]
MKVNYVSNFNDTKAYGYKDQTTEAPRSTVPTIRKGATLTKPPVDQNNSHILSNKIETETIKALNIGTTPVPSSTKPITKESLQDLTMAPDTTTLMERQLPLRILRLLTILRLQCIRERSQPQRKT